MVFLSFISPPTQIQSSSDRDVVQSACPYLVLPNKRLPSGARARATGLGICRWHAPKRSPHVLHQKLRAHPRSTMLLRRKASTLALITPIRSARDKFTCPRCALLAARTKSFQDISSEQVRQCVLDDVTPESREWLPQ